MLTTQVLADTTEQTLMHHLEAFLNNDLEALMEDYADTAEVWTPEGPVVGWEAIRNFFSWVFTLLPKASTHLELKQKIVKDGKAYIVWSAESAVISIPLGSDNFEITNGQIALQTATAYVIPK